MRWRHKLMTLRARSLSLTLNRKWDRIKTLGCSNFDCYLNLLSSRERASLEPARNHATERSAPVASNLEFSRALWARRKWSFVQIRAYNWNSLLCLFLFFVWIRLRWSALARRKLLSKAQFGHRHTFDTFRLVSNWSRAKTLALFLVPLPASWRK